MHDSSRTKRVVELAKLLFQDSQESGVARAFGLTIEAFTKRLSRDRTFRLHELLILRLLYEAKTEGRLEHFLSAVDEEVFADSRGKSHFASHQRAQEMASAREAGETYTSIGKRYDVSASAVSQQITKHYRRLKQGK